MLPEELLACTSIFLKIYQLGVPSNDLFIGYNLVNTTEFTTEVHSIE